MPSGSGGESPAGAASATVGPNGGGGSSIHGHSSAAPAGAAETIGSGIGRAGSHAAAGTSDRDGGAAAGPIGGGPLDGGSSRSGGVGRASGGMRLLDVQVSEPRRFTVHSYAGLLPMPRVAMLSGLTEMEWVGICELWDTTGEVQNFCRTRIHNLSNAISYCQCCDTHEDRQYIANASRLTSCTALLPLRDGLVCGLQLDLAAACH